VLHESPICYTRKSKSANINRVKEAKNFVCPFIYARFSLHTKVDLTSQPKVELEAIDDTNWEIYIRIVLYTPC
jgi:hypothetical protein